MQPFDLLNTPLRGTNLIEAGAGTGKTYTIAGLFVRLILEEQVPVEKILVVTFTIAATEELKDRIRKKLVQVKSGLIYGNEDDPFISELSKRQSDSDRALQRIDEAIIDFDRAAIFTIHGFCQRIIHENAFEIGSLFDTELAADQSHFLQEVTDDFWRKHFYRAPKELVNYALSAGKIPGPSFFHELLNRINAPEILIIPEMQVRPLRNLKSYRACLTKLTSSWAKARHDVADLLRDPSLKGNIYGSLSSNDRELKIASMLESMDRFVESHSIGFPLFDGFQRFTHQKLSLSVKKGLEPPNHEIFHLCDELLQKGEDLKKEIERRLLSLKIEFFKDSKAALKKRKQEKNILFFDDLLLLVKQTLEADGGDILATAIRRQYQAALVDEFQDTDAVQYHIFSKLFSKPTSILFMIGDPKQAIYGFRGADVFSYLKAVQDARNKYTLTHNWRSDPKLISAVNSLFSSVQNPFVFKDIPYETASPGNDLFRADTEEKPFRIWFLPAEENRPIPKEDAYHLISEQVGQEISRMLQQESRLFGADDIAVLVRTNRQAQIVKTYLTRKDIPSVLFQSGNIFDSHEAEEIQTLLLSIAEPGHEGRFRTALSCDLMGFTGESLQSAEEDASRWEGYRSHFREYHEIWNDQGFIRMFRMLMTREKAKERLLSLPDGERRLTNLLHLEELLHQTAVDKKLGISGLIKWLSEQRAPSSPRLEEHQLRLESDENSVKIVTIHKSKGLEYPVIFCPFCWEASLVRGSGILFHTDDENRRLALDLGSKNLDHHSGIAQEELLAENLRLLYVAVTRAIKRCYLIWGQIRSAETSAIAYLLHFSPSSATGSILMDLKAQYSALSGEKLYNDLKALQERSGGSIELETLPLKGAAKYSIPSCEPEKLEHKRFSSTIDLSWKISSYSSLISRRIKDTELPDRDDNRSIDSEFIDSRKGFNIFRFPKGARAGLFFHEIFEQLDFQNASPQICTPMIEEKLRDYGFDTEWRETVYQLIQNVISIPLPTDINHFALSAISSENRINEMEFYFPLHPFSPQTLQDIFSEHAGIRISTGFPDRLERLVFSPASGFMKGYMDLVFFHEGRFFLIDWKSNHLGSKIDEYGKEALNTAMGEDYYILQYHLYVLALDLYLTQRLPGYHYSRDFGGVFYLFIRGIDTDRGPEFGIYSDQPNIEMIDALKQALLP
ncbi:MAG TPA: exodeoxyribonuclease V subunit beta [Deltaproteobacteria bacterium]|nr:exodeoxyribonuclease V subunit beta [Deltaproteobacteria bacterium]